MSAQPCTDFAELTRWTEAELRDEINERHGMVRVNQTHGMLVNCLCNIRHAQRASELRRQESHLAIAFASLPLDLTMRSFHSGLSLARKAAEKGCLRGTTTRSLRRDHVRSAPASPTSRPYLTSFLFLLVDECSNCCLLLKTKKLYCNTECAPAEC